MTCRADVPIFERVHCGCWWGG